MRPAVLGKNEFYTIGDTGKNYMAKSDVLFSLNITTDRQYERHEF